MYTRRVYNHIPGVVAAALTLFPAAVPYPGRNSFVPTTRHSGHAPRCRGRSCRRPPPRPAPPQCAQLCRAARRTRARARNARAVRVCVRRRCARARARVYASVAATATAPTVRMPPPTGTFTDRLDATSPRPRRPVASHALSRSPRHVACRDQQLKRAKTSSNRRTDHTTQSISVVVVEGGEYTSDTRETRGGHP